ncbi:MAG TPA: tetratricopeptide repeat protein [Bryobacteraceae bacterium]|nr:tetratricopeptide repeat protein [Bryobacteraceae bacterium]
MSRVGTGILMLGFLLAAHGAPRHRVEASVTPVGGNTGEIASAREALRQATAALGEDHPVTAFMLRNLALAMQEGGYPNYAEHYAQQSLAILQRHFGASDVSLVPALNVLAEASVAQARYDEARKFAMRAIAIGPDAGAHYATALHNLAAVFHSEGKFQNAAEYYQQALAVREKLFPPGHPYIKMTRAALEQVERSAKVTARR